MNEIANTAAQMCQSSGDSMPWATAFAIVGVAWAFAWMMK